ncbi:hypothetical protein [Clostridium aminobutyricum]|uniref:Ethanolamine utilization protein n=1 Tax=Clostridium aminobutyricum TaxID=33953 RepID=A0A939D9T7_CLOAM|nr:hypothetical protein [Clostridium aminobutyricum]MBN7773811.1 hypothetical protein [Clostridium aminobutyricum]
MEFKELVEQIAVKVAERIAELEESLQIEAPSSVELCPKPKILILTEDHGTACHELLEKESLKHKFEIICALNEEYQCDSQQFDRIVLGSFSNTSLGKIAEGIGDTPFTQAVMKAILLGKQLIVPNEEMELFQYRETAPKLYYGRMMQKIEFLKNIGIQFCNADQLESILLGNEGVPEKKSCTGEPAKEVAEVCENKSGGSVKFEKRIITERDIRTAYEQHATQICIAQKTIITDLAREYAEQRGISFTIG